MMDLGTGGNLKEDLVNVGKPRRMDEEQVRNSERGVLVKGSGNVNTDVVMRKAIP